MLTFASTMSMIKYINRQSGNTVVEDIPGGGFLRFLYGGNPLGKLSLWVLVKRKYFSVLFGKYMDSKLSKKKIVPFIQKYKIDMDEYQDDIQSFDTFNQFFYRKIKPVARPIGSGVVSPADGRVLVFEDVSDAQKFFIKGSEFDLSSFLGKQELAKKYAGGAMVIIRLAPVDYHRFHFPVSGTVGQNCKIDGSYYSVSPLALRKSLTIFCQNKREYCEVVSKSNGSVLICDVGATLTGGIVQTFAEKSLVAKGSEKGYFSFGGSTLVVLFEKGKVSLNQDLLENTKNGFETFLKTGETIGQ